MWKNLGIVFLLLAALSAPFAVAAQQSQQSREPVARVSVIQGETSYQRGDDQDWNALGANTPLMTGDSLYAAQDGRAEVDLGNGNAVRLDNSTALDIMNLSEEVTQLGLSQGDVNVRVRDIPRNGTMEVATPLGAATIWEPGSYRVGLDGDNARFGVVSGRLSVTLNGQQLDVQEGEVLELQGGDDPSYDYSRLPRASSFDRWSEDRDSRRQRSDSSRYVHSNVMGYDDLDDNGAWQRDRTYGNVWYPSHVSNNWAPYQTGRWMWQDPYGWTWVSYEPWGWAPYHYGRWVYVRNAWGWVPPPPHGYRGPRVVMNIQPYYAPALVAFIGGSNWSVGISIGGGGGGFVGWVPLGPRDPYSYNWQRPVQVTNVTYQNIYINNSVTVVNYNNFANGVVTPIPVGRDVIRRAPRMGQRPVGITPGQGSLAPYPGVKVPPRAMPMMDRPLVVRSTPPPKPVSFKHKVAEIQKTGRPFARPVASDASVGKPFRPGMKAPEGVQARPALAPEDGNRQPRLKPMQGQEFRPPKQVQQDVIKPTENPRKMGDPGEQPLPEKPWKRMKPDQPQPGGPDEPTYRKPMEIRPTVEPGGREPEPPKREHPPAVRPSEPPKREQPPAVRPPEPPKREQPPAVRPPEPPKREHPPAVRPSEPPKREQPPAVRPPEPPKREQPPAVRPPEPPKREHQPPVQPGAGQPEQPKRGKELQPPTQPGAGQPEQPKRGKELQPPTQPGAGQPEQPKRGKELQPPSSPQDPPLTPEEKKRAEENNKAEEKKMAEERKRAEDRVR